MDQTTITAIVIVVAVLAVLAAIIIVYRKHRRQHLKQHFGAEYDRAVRELHDPGKAEKELSPAARDRFAEEWNLVQSRFVDDPAVAVSEADSLVNRVMSARGYPMGDFEQRAADVSVTHPTVVQNYRAARVIVQRHGRGEAATEDLRQAMVHYRSLFDELLGVRPAVTATRGVLHERAS
jgi:hypothetical protein